MKIHTLYCLLVDLEFLFDILPVEIVLQIGRCDVICKESIAISINYQRH